MTARSTILLAGVALLLTCMTHPAGAAMTLSWQSDSTGGCFGVPVLEVSPVQPPRYFTRDANYSGIQHLNLYDANNGNLVVSWGINAAEAPCDVIRIWRVGDVNGNGQDDFVVEVDNREVHLFDKVLGPLAGDIAVWSDETHTIQYRVAYVGVTPIGSTTKLCIVRTVPDLAQPQGQDNAFYLYDLGTTPAAVEPSPAPTGTRLEVEQSRPNPFRGFTRIPFMLSRPGAVELRIVDVAGRLVRTMSENAGARSGEFWWDGMDDAGRPAGAGAFFYDVRVDGLAQGGKMTLLR